MLTKHHVRSFVLLSFVALSACKHERDVVPRAQALIDRAYACTDLACADAVWDDLTKLNDDAFEAHDLNDQEAEFLSVAIKRIYTQVDALKQAKEGDRGKR